MANNIYIIGFMGVGKTTVGTRLAKQLEMQFLDTDDVFAARHNGMTTGEYIRTFGLQQFRPEEEATLKYIAENVQDAVVATGGGVPTYGDNLGIMKRSGTVLHISVPLDVLSRRMSPEELAKRPVWAGKSPEELARLFNEREAIYNKADVILNGNQPPETIIADAIAALKCR